MSLNEVYDMDIEDLDMLWNSLSKIEAQELLVRYHVADWPQTKKEERRRLHRRAFREAYGDQEEKTVIQSAEELAAFLSGG